MMKKYFSILFLILIILARLLAGDESVKVMKSFLIPEPAEDWNITLVIDPGHGGRDPGKVGVNGDLEKDINLKVALKLGRMLEEEGIDVILTREEDISLCGEGSSFHKREDMNKRVEIINSNNALFAVSIHQNSFTQTNVKGAQVFYHTASAEGKELALILQQQLKDNLKDGNHRQAKSNDSYFMLKYTNCPLVIVECGYLSNPDESVLLIKDEYQDKLAEAICEGIMKYIRNTSSNQ